MREPICFEELVDAVACSVRALAIAMS